MNRATACSCPSPHDGSLWIDKRLPKLFMAPTVILLLALGNRASAVCFRREPDQLGASLHGQPDVVWLSNYIQVFEMHASGMLPRTLASYWWQAGLQLLFGLDHALLLNRSFV